MAVMHANFIACCSRIFVSVFRVKIMILFGFEHVFLFSGYYDDGCRLLSN